MPKGTNQKFKLYRLTQIMLEQMDDEYYITMPGIKEALARYAITADQEHFTVNATVMVSSVFLGWVFSRGARVKILEPEKVVEKMREEGERLMRQYQRYQRQ